MFIIQINHLKLKDNKLTMLVTSELQQVLDIPLLILLPMSLDNQLQLDMSHHQLYQLDIQLKLNMSAVDKEDTQLVDIPLEDML